MRCPYCGSENSRVVDSRPAEDNNAIRRRRQCDECGKRFTTYEKIETEPLSVIKKDKTRQLYDRNKIRNGIVQSCHKLLQHPLKSGLSGNDISPSVHRHAEIASASRHVLRISSM